MTKSPTRHNPWPDYFHRAAQEEIGLVIEFAEATADLTTTILPAARPEGFEDYTIATGSIPNTIFIVKPGVRLD